MGGVMEASEIERCFATPDGGYAFARWNRPIAPVIFGVDDQSLPVLKGGIEAVAKLAGVEVAETDPELGSNMMVFFIREWDELTATPSMNRLVPKLADAVGNLKAADAAQYRFFRYDDDGAIRAAFLFVRLTDDMARQPAESIALVNAVQMILTWGPGAFAATSPIGVHQESEAVVLKPEFADLIRAAYDPVMPVAANDSVHALRMAVRVGMNRVDEMPG